MTLQAADDNIVAALLPAFMQEASEQIEAYEQLLLQLEDDPAEPGLLDALFRCAHTVKGSAGVFGLDRVVAFTHHVETLLDQLREGRIALTPALSTLLLQSNDEIRQLVDHATGDDDPAAQARRAELVARLQAACADAGLPEAAPPASPRWQVAVRFGPETFRHGMDPLTILNYLARLGPISGLCCDLEALPGLEALEPDACHLGFRFAITTPAPRAEIEDAFSFVREDCELQLTGPGEAAPAEASTAAPGGAPEAAPPAGPGLPAEASPALPAAASGMQRPREGAAAPDDGGFIRVHAHRLDAVINLLGELVIAGAGASMLARQTRQRSLIEANQQITRLIEGIRNSTLKLRMVPIGETFARFRRVVRDTAADLGKDVVLQIEGGDTELDKAVVERIADPLMHLVRNALDHGLEHPAERQAAGKPAQGRLTLSACHESGGILIRIVDDGRGIQRDKVLQRAWQRGLLEPGVVPADAEILDLIFAPGFSTAEQVTALSGRGVGMDVVRRNIEALRGSVTVDSQPGQGSCIEIRLPLTLAIIDGFLVGVGASRFIFPLESVVEVIASRCATTTLDRQGRGCVDLRGQMLPVVDLRALYGLEPGAPERRSIVVLRAGSRRFGVLVDALLGQHQTVIKPLGRLLRSLRGVSGTSILGTGEVALIFDVEALSQRAGGGRTAAPAGRPAADLATRPQPIQRVA